jgi:hypothetical protein
LRGPCKTIRQPHRCRNTEHLARAIDRAHKPFRAKLGQAGAIQQRLFPESPCQLPTPREGPQHEIRHMPWAVSTSEYVGESAQQIIGPQRIGVAEEQGLA